jgi:hypothetical protein
MAHKGKIYQEFFFLIHLDVNSPTLSLFKIYSNKIKAILKWIKV